MKEELTFRRPKKVFKRAVRPETQQAHEYTQENDKGKLKRKKTN